jgi:hypothetical protein
MCGCHQRSGNKTQRLPEGWSHVLNFPNSRPFHQAPTWGQGLCSAAQPDGTDPPPQELFKRVVPYHCLGSTWSKWDKVGKEPVVPTI